MSRDCANSLSSPSEIFIDCILLTLNTLQQSQLHTWQSQLHTLCQKTHNFRPCPYCVDTVKLSSNLFTVGLPHHCSFSYQTLWQYSDRYPSTGPPWMHGYEKNRNFRHTFRFISEMIQDRPRTANRKRKLSNGAIINDLEWPGTQISRSGIYYVTLNI